MPSPANSYSQWREGFGHAFILAAKRPSIGLRVILGEIEYFPYDLCERQLPALLPSVVVSEVSLRLKEVEKS